MSKYLPEKRFSFISNADTLDEETFGVVQFKGFEGISVPYEFDIMLVSDDPSLNIDEMMAISAKFIIHREDGRDVEFHGILSQFEQLHKYQEYIFYRAYLVPRFWWLSLTHHNQVCLGKTIPEIIALTLKDAGLTTLDFEFRTQHIYPPIEYVCQYNESHFNFISRWLEREGIYYYFDQRGNEERIVFTDTNIAHIDFPIGGDVFYSPTSGLIETEKSEYISTFTCKNRQLPRSVYMKDHNYLRPSMSIVGSADVDPRGRGVDYLFGERFTTAEEGDRLAAIRAQELNCRKREFTGESTVPFMSPGFTFNLLRHYRASFNQRYLVTHVSHEGSQIGYLIPSINEGLSGYKSSIYYKNTFSAIPSEVQFRPEKKANKPRIAGSIHATIDAEGSGTYAELDRYGRYKIRLPFDINDDNRAGKASSYIRMIQPYANRHGGMQFPLVKGTEVLLTFIDGDPDRPVIAGAVSNPENPSPVNSANQTESVIQTGSFNKIRMQDRAGEERIIMQSPTANSWVRIGAPNDPDAPAVNDVDQENAIDGIRLHTDKDITLSSGEDLVANISGNNDVEIMGDKTEIIHGDHTQVIGIPTEQSRSTTTVCGNVTRTITGDDTDIVNCNRESDTYGKVQINTGNKDAYPKVRNADDPDEDLVVKTETLYGDSIADVKGSLGISVGYGIKDSICDVQVRGDVSTQISGCNFISVKKDSVETVKYSKVVDSVGPIVLTAKSKTARDLEEVTARAEESAALRTDAEKIGVTLPQSTASLAEKEQKLKTKADEKNKAQQEALTATKEKNEAEEKFRKADDRKNKLVSAGATEGKAKEQTEWNKFHDDFEAKKVTETQKKDALRTKQKEFLDAKKELAQLKGDTNEVASIDNELTSLEKKNADNQYENEIYDCVGASEKSIDEFIYLSTSGQIMQIGGKDILIKSEAGGLVIICKSDLNIKSEGGKVNIEASGDVSIKGGSIKLNC